MRVLLELVRIMALFLIVGGVASSLLQTMYSSLGTAQYAWIGYIAIFLLLFVFYRNKWQFSGWDKGTVKSKLSKSVTRIFITSGVMLLFLPIVLHFIV